MTINWPFTFFLLACAILFAYFSYRPFYRWYDRRTPHQRLGFYIFSGLSFPAALLLAYRLDDYPPPLQILLLILCVCVFFPPMVLLLLAQTRDLTRREIEPAPPAPEPTPPPSPPQPTTEEMIQDLLKQNRR